MTGNGNVTIVIPAASATNSKGQNFPASNSATVVLDTVAPTVTIDKAVGQADPTNLSPITFTIGFSEAVIGFLASDIVFTGSTAGGTLAAFLTGSGASYNVQVTGMTTAVTGVLVDNASFFGRRYPCTKLIHTPNCLTYLSSKKPNVPKIIHYLVLE
jgi:hypothetical protein